MKRVLKTLGLAFFVVAILCMILVLIILYVKQLNERFIGEHGITAHVVEENENVDETKVDVSINITGNNVPTTKNEELYCDSMQEALAVSTVPLEIEERYMKNMDEIIKVFENDKCALVFYRAIKDEKEEAYNYVKFNVRLNEGKKQYDFVKLRKSIYTIDGIFIADAREVIEGSIISSEIGGNMGINPEEERFVFGNVCEELFCDGESIDYFKIEGQKPDEIIEYECFGKKWYFWYYNDLQSNKNYDELKFTLTEE